MCKVTPREVIEATLLAWKAEDAAAEAARKAAEAEKQKNDPKPTQPAPRRTRRRGGPDNSASRCRAYMGKFPPAVEGQDGSGQMFKAARVIWNDFGLDEAEGYPLLQAYNATCLPPFNEKELRHKWGDAVKHGPGPEGRGYKLNVDRRGSPHPRGGGSPHADAGDTSDADGVEEPPRTRSGLPEIIINNRQYRDVEADALAALVRANRPPTVFVGNGCGLVDLMRDEPDAPLAARELDAASMRSVFGRVADWIKATQTQDGVRRDDDFPPPPLLASFPVRGQWPNIPYLRSVVTYPVYGPNWVLNATQGYHPESYIFSDLGNLVVPHVADRPTAEDVAAAKELLVTELLGDFPFVGEAGKPNASLANAVAMLVLPVIRHAIDGPTPLAVIDAPAEGTGKSLLAEVVTLTTVGEIPEAVSPDVPDEEWNKMLLAMLIAGQPIVYLDNANKRIDSASFASTLTATRKSGRILGETKMGRARINVCWILTGNNVEVSREIARRVYWSRIDRGVENPSVAPVKYRYPDILDWVKRNRPRLLAAILTLVNNWLAKDRPPGTEVLGKFEAWSRAVGGILTAAGIDGLLGNAEDFRKQCANQASEMPDFIEKWYEKHAGTLVIAKDLYECAEGVLDSVLTAKDEKGRRTQLGKFLRTQRDKVYGGWRIKFSIKEDGGKNQDYAKRPRYQLEAIKKPPSGEGEFDISG